MVDTEVGDTGSDYSDEVNADMWLQKLSPRKEGHLVDTDDPGLLDDVIPNLL